MEPMAKIDDVQFRSNNNVAAHVVDLDKARDFYGGVLRFRLVEEGKDRLVYDTGAFRLFVNKDDSNMSFIPALEVVDYEKAKGYLLSHGCRIIKEWEQFKALYFEDPFGFVYDIIQR